MPNSIIANQLDYARPQPIKLTKEEWEAARERCDNIKITYEVIHAKQANVVDTNPMVRFCDRFCII